jgi:OOP family OmpA-OmpF porin
MKKITFLILLSLTFFASVAQEKSTTDSIVKKNNWIIEGSVGHIKGIKPYSEGYFSSKTNGYFGQLKPNSFALGARYIMSDIFSVKASVGLDIISNFNNESLIDGKPSLPFKMQQINMQFQGFANGAKLFNVQDRLKRWGFLFHGGIQIVAMTSKTKNIPEGTPGFPNGEVHNYNLTEYNGGIMFGVTPQYRITKRAAIQLDVTTVHNYRQHFNWDGMYSDNQENLSGSTVGINLGLSYSLDKNTIHGDWYSYKNSVENKEVDDLKNRIKDLETLMNDTDKDGVADYLDQENNSVAGVAVDSRGKMVDINRNGVPDELERYINSSSKETSEKASDDLVESLINQGFISVYFDFNKSTPNIGSTENLDFIRTYLKNHPNATAELTGYADEIGNSPGNDKLSSKRSEVVREILIKAGIDGSRLRIVGRGEDSSVAVDSEGARKLVRKVVFKIIK